MNRIDEIKRYTENCTWDDTDLQNDLRYLLAKVEKYQLALENIRDNEASDWPKHSCREVAREALKDDRA